MEPDRRADDDRPIGGDRHYASCNHALCPCYLAGLRSGVKQTGAALLGALEIALNDGDE